MPARKFGGSESKNHVPPVISVPLQQQQHCHVQSLGPPHLQIFRVSLPIHLRAKLPPIVSACEQYAASTRNGWETNLYSLTKQDIPLSDVPNGMRLVAEVQECILSTVQRLYHPAGGLHMDRNQPHVLKYNCNSVGNAATAATTDPLQQQQQGHRSVPLHTDRCHVTINLMLSDACEYQGGGTFFAAINQRFVLNQGQFLVHPGHLVHGGCEITAGVRHLMLYFLHFAPRMEDIH